MSFLLSRGRATLELLDMCGNTQCSINQPGSNYGNQTNQTSSFLPNGTLYIQLNLFTYSNLSAALLNNATEQSSGLTFHEVIFVIVALMLTAQYSLLKHFNAIHNSA